jgi:hypothetical protein
MKRCHCFVLMMGKDFGCRRASSVSAMRDGISLDILAERNRKGSLGVIVTIYRFVVLRLIGIFLEKDRSVASVK